MPSASQATATMMTPTDPPPPNLLEIEEQLRRHFGRLKRQQRQSAYRPHPRFNNEELWRKAAENCANLRASPYSFVLAAFLYNTVPGGPFPQQLTGGAAIKWYLTYQKVNHAKDDEDPFLLDTQNKLLTGTQMALTHPFYGPSQALMIEANNLPAWVRLVLCPDDAAIWAGYGRIAAQELGGCPPLYDALVKLGTNVTLLKRILKHGE